LSAFNTHDTLASLALETERDGRSGVWEWCPDDGSVRWSPGLFAMLGIDIATPLCFDDISRLIVPDDREAFQHFCDQCLNGTPPKDVILGVFGQRDRVLHIRTRVRIPEVDAEGRPHLIRGTVYDVSDLMAQSLANKRALQAAQADYRRLEDALGAIGDGFSQWDTDDRLILWNRRFAEIHAPIRQHIRAGISISDFLRYALDAGLFVAARGQEEEWLADRLRHRQGSSDDHLFSDGHWYRVIHGLAPDGSRVKVLEDVTDEKQRAIALQESEERYRVLFQGCRSVQLLIDPETGQIVDANDAACRYYGYTRKKLLSLRANDINVLPLDQLHTLLQRSADRTQQVFPGRHRLASGEERDVETRSGPVMISGRLLIYAVVQDVSDRRAAEAERDALLTRLAQSNAELEHFAHIASHDLREPLRTITSSLGLVMRRHADKVPPEAREFLEFALASAGDLDTLIVDLLDYARAGHESHASDVSDSREVLEQALAALAASIQDAGAIITWDREPWPTIPGDARQLRSLFVNLISNALKYRHSDRTPRLHLSYGRVNEDGHPQVFIGVSDNGIGIPDTERDRIFSIFHRLHPRHAFPGTGIGLAIARKVVDHIGGQILVESEEGQGSTFKVLFPPTPRSHGPD